MKFNTAWLREWVATDLDAEALGERLTMAGLELDSITPAAPEFSGVTVAEITALSPVEGSDHLNLCDVDTGKGETVKIVCGASNARQGLKTALAAVGAVLPGGTKIKRAKLRGVDSFGMLCSAKELGLSEDASGLIELPQDAPVGEALRDYLQLDDTILEVDLTPNRADCLSIQGIAREASALVKAEFVPHEIPEITATSSRTFGVDLLTESHCPQYVGRVIEGINTRATTPVWMQERLRRCGIRAISPVVDVTNYVMLELGQPMHAFDLDQLNGGIRVRLAEAGEKLVLLDGQTVELDNSTLVISDHKEALAIAGIMGGEQSGVSETTRNIFLESAWFAPEHIAGHARKYGLHTESSHRFERGVDPLLQRQAVERATQLYIEIVGGSAGPVVEVQAGDYAFQSPSIPLRLRTVNRMLGMEFSAQRVTSILNALQCETHADGEDAWQVIPPAYRFDLALEVDLVEEVARLHGYDNIPGSVPVQRPQIEIQQESKISVQRIRDLLVDRGYREVITYSFVDPEWEALFNPGHSPRVLSNPISSELAAMRSSLWPGLVRTVQYNLNRQHSRVRVFESGLKFTVSNSNLLQTRVLAGAITGSRQPENWSAANAEVDFYDLKGDVESVLKLGKKALEIQYTTENISALHPGQSAAISVHGQQIGCLGALHPALARQLDIDQPVFLFELDMEALLKADVPKFTALSRFPAIRRDIALLVDNHITAEQIEASIRSENVMQLKEINIFDVYTGEGVPFGRKSIALSLILQDFSRTLNDQEVDDLQTRILQGLQQRLQATLRE